MVGVCVQITFEPSQKSHVLVKKSILLAAQRAARSHCKRTPWPLVSFFCCLFLDGSVWVWVFFGCDFGWPGVCFPVSPLSSVRFQTPRPIAFRLRGQDPLLILSLGGLQWARGSVRFFLVLLFLVLVSLPGHPPLLLLLPPLLSSSVLLWRCVFLFPLVLVAVLPRVLSLVFVVGVRGGFSFF